MSNLETVKAVTENILRVLTREGVVFRCRTGGAQEQIPASALPFGELYYEGEEFEYRHASHPGFIDARFKVRLLLCANNPVETITDEQKWVHALKSALTVAALNSGDLSTSRLVSKVTAEGVSIENRERFSVLSSQVVVRYRES